MCSGGGRQPDTSAQEAEAARQRDLEDQRQRELLEAQRAEAERQRLENARIAAEKLAQDKAIADANAKLLRDQEAARIARDLELDQRNQQIQARDREAREREAAEARRVADAREAQRVADVKRQEETTAAETQRLRDEKARTDLAAQKKAEATREYADGRERFTNQAYEFVDRAYKGFDDSYFDKFANDFVSYYKPEVQRQFDGANKSLTYQLADSGNLNSSSAANEFGELVRQRGQMEAGIGSRALTARDQLRQSLEAQKSEARAAVLSTSGIGENVELDDISQVGDALSSYGRKLQTPVLGARSSATNFQPGGYSSLSSLVGDLTVPTIRGSSARTTRTTQPSGLSGAPGLDASSLRVVA